MTSLGHSAAGATVGLKKKFESRCSEYNARLLLTTVVRNSTKTPVQKHASVPKAGATDCGHLTRGRHRVTFASARRVRDERGARSAERREQRERFKGICGSSWVVFESKRTTCLCDKAVPSICSGKLMPPLERRVACLDTHNRLVQ